MRVLCDIGVSSVVGRTMSSSFLERGELRRGLSAGKSEIADRICGVVVRRTIGSEWLSAVSRPGRTGTI